MYLRRKYLIARVRLFEELKGLCSFLRNIRGIGTAGHKMFNTLTVIVTRTTGVVSLVCC